MIEWLVDRWWLYKNRDALRQLDEEMDALRAQSEQLDRQMKEMYGPDWRLQTERRLKAVGL